VSQLRAVLLSRTPVGCVQERDADGKVEQPPELASACCALAEKLMEGAADVTAVQTAVEGALAQAREADATSPEPLQVRHSSGRLLHCRGHQSPLGYVVLCCPDSSER
jgi:hypothetical protein